MRIAWTCLKQRKKTMELGLLPAYPFLPLRKNLPSLHAVKFTEIKGSSRYVIERHKKKGVKMRLEARRKQSNGNL